MGLKSWNRMMLWHLRIQIKKIMREIIEEGIIMKNSRWISILKKAKEVTNNKKTQCKGKRSSTKTTNRSQMNLKLSIKENLEVSKSNSKCCFFIWICWLYGILIRKLYLFLFLYIVTPTRENNNISDRQRRSRNFRE